MKLSQVHKNYIYMLFNYSKFTNNLQNWSFLLGNRNYFHSDKSQDLRNCSF